MSSEFWLPPSYKDRQLHKKAAPPKFGPSYGAWGGDLNAYNPSWDLPGGTTLQFDLNKLTLSDFRQMRNHYQINASLSVLVFTMHQLDWWIECEDPKIADAIETNIRETWTRLIRAISQAYWAGFSPIAMEFENDRLAKQIKVNKFKDLVPEQCEINWKKVKGAPPVGAGATERPERYIYDGIKQFGESGHIPADHTLWYPVFQENGDMRGRKLLKPAFPSYFFSQLIHLFTNRYFERFGEPLVVGRAPFDEDVVTETGTTQSGRDATIQMIKDLRNRSAVVLPNERSVSGNGDKNDYEYTLDFLESQMRGADFDRYLKTLDEEMSLAMFVPVLLFRTADVGSYNLGQAHERTFMFQVNGLAGDLAEYLDRFVLSRLVDINFSPKAPRARFVFRRMGKDRDETLRAILQGSIQQEQIRPDIAELGMALGMRLHEIKQVVDPNTGNLIPEGDPVKQQAGADDDTGSTPPERVTSDTSPNTNLTIRKTTDRLLSQLSREGAEPKAELGYRRKMWEAMMQDDIPAEQAEASVRRAYGIAEEWLGEVIDLGFDDIGPERASEIVADILADNLT